MDKFAFHIARLIKLQKDAHAEASRLRDKGLDGSSDEVTHLCDLTLSYALDHFPPFVYSEELHRKHNDIVFYRLHVNPLDAKSLAELDPELVPVAVSKSLYGMQPRGGMKFTCMPYASPFGTESFRRFVDAYQQIAIKEQEGGGVLLPFD